MKLRKINFNQILFVFLPRSLEKKESLIKFYPRLNFMKSLNLQFKYLEYCVFNVLILHILYVKLQASGESGENSHLYRAFGVLSSGRRKD